MSPCHIKDEAKQLLGLENSFSPRHARLVRVSTRCESSEVSLWLTKCYAEGLKKTTKQATSAFMVILQLPCTIRVNLVLCES